MRKEHIGLKKIENAIPIGQKIEVYVPEGSFRGTYSSFIYDMDQQFIYVLIPTNENGLKAVIRKGDLFYVSFVNKKNRRVGFSTSLIDVIKDDTKVIYKIEKPQEAYIIELRENFRVDVLIKTDITYIKNSTLFKTNGAAIDISASGAKLSVGVSIEDRFEIGDVVFISFDLDSIKLHNMEAKIVRRALSKGDRVNHYGLYFINLNKKLEESIIKFCINKQLELARKMRGL